MDAAHPGDVELQLALGLTDQRAEQDIAVFQLEAIFADGSDRLERRRKMHGVHARQSKLERTGE